MTKLWGGRFTKKTNPLVEQFTKSIHFDQKLAFCDCWGSMFHIDILKESKLISEQEYKKVHDALHEIAQSVQSGSLKVEESFEDIHSFIQHLVEKKAGDVALKLHTCRSRNDQVVFATKLFCQMQLKHFLILLTDLENVFLKLIKANESVHIPGYTHLQHAIPIRLSDGLMAYVEMLRQDFKRLTYIKDNINLTMGSGALAGTFIDSEHYDKAMSFVSAEIGIVKPSHNSIHTVSDRDFVIEILSALALVGMHLSRLSEDFILWSTKEFDFIDIDESFCTGSSLMPQKKNPDVLELIRGYTGKLYGNLMNVLVIMKGLPLSYNRDMQHDKEPLFDSLNIVENELKILTELIGHIHFKKENIAKQLTDEGLYATDLADYLVQKGVPFKDAHTTIGQLVHYKISSKKELKKMSAAELKKFHPLLTPMVVQKLIDPQHSVDSKKSIKRVVHKPLKSPSRK